MGRQLQKTTNPDDQLCPRMIMKRNLSASPKMGIFQRVPGNRVCFPNFEAKIENLLYDLNIAL